MDKSEIWQFMFSEYPCVESRGHNPVPDPGLTSFVKFRCVVEYDFNSGTSSMRTFTKKVRNLLMDALVWAQKSAFFKLFLNCTVDELARFKTERERGVFWHILSERRVLSRIELQGVKIQTARYSLQVKRQSKFRSSFHNIWGWHLLVESAL